MLVGCRVLHSDPGWSQESFAAPGFNQAALSREGLALLPVIIMAEPTPKVHEGGGPPLPAPYTPSRRSGRKTGMCLPRPATATRSSDQTLLGKIRSKWPGLRLIPAGDSLKMLNDAGLSGISGRIMREFSTLGLDGKLLRKLGSALHTRYVLIGRGIVTESKYDASVSAVWSFGRKTVMRSVSVSAQIWDTSTQKLAWEGRGGI